MFASFFRLLGVRRRNVLASYLCVGGCREEKCFNLVPTCGWVSGGEMCLLPT